MVWIVEQHQPGQSEVYVTPWDDETKALKHAASDIMDAVRDWDLSDQDWKERAIEINNAVSVGNWREALSLYNDWEGNGDYEYSTFYSVYERDLHTSAINPVPMLIVDDDDEECEDEDDDDCDEEEEEESYQALSPGATCRGPCQNYNEHAYADKRDGTYCCYQCRMMSQVFGGSIT